MITRKELRSRQNEACALFRQAGIPITRAEKAAIEAADFGLNEFERTGLGLPVCVNTDRSPATFSRTKASSG